MLRFRGSPIFLASVIEVKLPDLAGLGLLAHGHSDVLPGVPLPRVEAEQAALVLQLPPGAQCPPLVLVFLVASCHTDLTLKKGSQY